jgi:hypothetical protein
MQSVTSVYVSPPLVHATNATTTMAITSITRRRVFRSLSIIANLRSPILSFHKTKMPTTARSDRQHFENAK